MAVRSLDPANSRGGKGAVSPRVTKARYLAMCLTLAGLLTACQAAEVTQAKRLIEDQLNDPASAQYKSIAVATIAKDAKYPIAPGTKVVCGRVNAKNKIGGYVGFRLFYAVPSSNIVIIQPNAPSKSLSLSDYDKSDWDDYRNMAKFIESFEAICLQGGAVDAA